MRVSSEDAECKRFWVEYVDGSIDLTLRTVDFPQRRNIEKPWVGDARDRDAGKLVTTGSLEKCEQFVTTVRLG